MMLTIIMRIRAVKTAIAGLDVMISFNSSMVSWFKGLTLALVLSCWEYEYEPKCVNDKCYIHCVIHCSPAADTASVIAINEAKMFGKGIDSYSPPVIFAVYDFEHGLIVVYG